MRSRTLSAETIEQLDRIDADEWNALCGAEPPFLQHDFLATLEATGCVGPATGWQPRHVVLRDARGRLQAAIPLYLKTHSWGEFVFDWSWAEAYHRVGLDYYPKLVAAVPFTPAPGARLLYRAGSDPAPLRARLLDAAEALRAASGASSLHVLFPQPDELDALRAAGLALRKDCQFHWHNDGYGDFTQFLAAFNSARRKKVRRERRRIAEAGIDIELRPAGLLDTDDWQRVYALYLSTYQKRGMTPYLTETFFPALAARMPRSLLVLTARLAGRTIAMALFLRSDRVLYGRYWGCTEEHHSLHFEACYYRGIDYCIEHGLARFEPGTQGEHKLLRGFRPALTWSAHWLADERLRRAVETYLRTERREIDRYVDAATDYLPFRAMSGAASGEP